jgi:hypothetical protein
MKTTQPWLPEYPSLELVSQRLSPRSLSDRTRGGYLRYIHKLADYCGRDPASLEEN